MDNKLSELKAAALAATQGPWFRSSVQFNGITTEETFITQGNKPHLANTSEKRDAIFIAAANPAVVLALLAELEAKDIRIAELEAIRAAAEKLVRCKGRYHSEQNYRALAALFGVTTPDLPPVDGDSEVVIAELRAKLATPVRLPFYEFTHPLTERQEGYLSAIIDVKGYLRRDGFTLDGDA
ncbi:ead/Ea22-like family protein [Serratia marcescens]|uniref:ead/Ea22-like family protein n=1 Tax=Serratia marcescens TaxID=615 RepID=UPI0018745352|nr:ead/Ea22-like family protein [Serratia marcescens]MBE5255624.1 ead/Ea22-like family protein [Serratia marcescens]MBE5299257.1 ead/Ea22-like family protein [Serratia marcescens]MBE5303206.1 ead/Ea22-like family protein [Serratia marcescens]